jgi:hypothetical protein
LLLAGCAGSRWRLGSRGAAAARSIQPALAAYPTDRAQPGLQPTAPPAIDDRRWRPGRGCEDGAFVALQHVGAYPTSAGPHGPARCVLPPTWPGGPRHCAGSLYRYDAEGGRRNRPEATLHPGGSAARVSSTKPTISPRRQSAARWVWVLALVQRQGLRADSGRTSIHRDPGNIRGSARSGSPQPARWPG